MNVSRTPWSFTVKPVTRENSFTFCFTPFTLNSFTLSPVPLGTVKQAERDLFGGLF